MSALTRDRATPYREGIEVEYPVAANTKIYAGSLVCVNAEGYAVPATDTGGYRMAGVALERADNSDGSDDGKHVRLRRAGVFEFEAINISQDMLGKRMYAIDDHTFAKADSYLVGVGILVKYVSATKGWIDIAR